MADKRSLSSRLRHRVRLIDPAPRPDKNALGETIDTASVEAANVPAEVKSLTGHELIVAQQVAAEATSLVTIRWRAGVDRFKSLEYEGRFLNINAAIDPDNLKVQLLLYCSEDT